MKYKQFLILFMKMHPMRCIKHCNELHCAGYFNRIFLLLINCIKKSIYIYIPIKADYNYIEPQKFQPFYKA